MTRLEELRAKLEASQRLQTSGGGYTDRAKAIQQEIDKVEAQERE